MNVKLKAAKSLFKIAYWKCRYGSRFKMPWIQGFDRVYLELSKKGHMSFGERNENRGRMHFICAGEGRLEIGNHVIYAIGGSITCMGHIKIGDYCRFGNNVVIVDHDHNFKSQDTGEGRALRGRAGGQTGISLQAASAGESGASGGAFEGDGAYSGGDGQRNLPLSSHGRTAVQADSGAA